LNREEIYKKISIKNENKMLLVILDGLGGLPVNGKTELETAQTPNLDKLASTGEYGLSHPVSRGITPGSGPAHLSLFGYDPFKYRIGRGILEALGIGIKVGHNDIAVRGNFASHKNGIITDRRAGRISTEKNKEIISYLRKKITTIEDVHIGLHSGEEHRFVLILTGQGLSDNITDADPEMINKPILYSLARTPDAERTASIINKFIIRLMEELKDFSPINTCLLRGAAKYPEIPSMNELFKLKTAAIAVYPMYKGLAQLVGMDILDTGDQIKDQVEALKKHYDNYNFFFFHIKKTDSYGEDGNFKKKVKTIEEFDQFLPKILKLKPDTLVITGDHSTPATMKSHSWHPNPILIKAPFQRNNATKEIKFSESECSLGILGQFCSVDILPLMMAHSQKFKKYGA
jgi:2,3-bisphosphoglycerate-independent phosphoglycerate mutase